MKQLDEAYQSWKEHHSSFPSAETLADQVITYIHQNFGSRRAGSWRVDSWLTWVSAHPFVRAALVASGAVVGLMRLAALTRVLLAC